MAEIASGLRMRIFWALQLCLSLVPAGASAQSVALEGNENPAWMRLRQHFQALSRQTDARPLRILHLGDSHTAASAFSGRMRTLFQQRYGDSGPGLLPPGELPGHSSGQLPPRQSDGWISQRDRSKSKMADDGALGGFAAFSLRPYQFLGYRLPVDSGHARLILYTDPEATSRPSRFKVFHEKKEVLPITRSLNGRSFYTLPAGKGQLEILSSNAGHIPRLRGINLLNETPGVSYCALGVNGAGFGILQEWRGPIVRMQMADYRPDLLILAFGTNDVVAPDFSREAFLNTLKQTESWLRDYAHHAAVLLVLPPGLPRHGAHVQENLNTLRQQVRNFAKNNGWYVWDWSHALNELPPTGETVFARDNIHLTSGAYTHSANRFFDALRPLL